MQIPRILLLVPLNRLMFVNCACVGYNQDLILDVGVVAEASI